MIRRLTIDWPVPLPTDRAGARPLRLLAVSDESDRALENERNREAIAPIDAVLGAGDLEPDYLAFLADAFRVPLLFVRGNHDRGANWVAHSEQLPRPLGARTEQVAGLTVAGMSWPAEVRGRALRDEMAAWRQALGLAWKARALRGRLIVLSHVPPRGLGDTPEDHYHRGFAAYHWLCRRLRPPLWLHGHTSPAALSDWRVVWGNTTLVNVTGAVLIELVGAASSGVTIGPQAVRTTEDN